MYGLGRVGGRFNSFLTSWLVVLLLAAGLLIPGLPTTATPAGAQDLVEQQIWGKQSGTAWKRLSDGTEQGTAWRQLGFDDSSWEDTTLREYNAHGSVPNDGRGYYYRTEFELTEIWQIDELRAEFYYDDATVMFLNGVEVYRTIRGNLPDDEELSIFQQIEFGGLENYYVQIPADSNSCENACGSGATDPIDLGLLQEGTNVIGIMAWTTPNSDLGVDLALSAVRDLNAQPPGPAIDPVADQASRLADSVDLQLTATSPNPPITWASTALPDGLQLDADTGVINGSPTAIGEWDITITSTDTLGSNEITFAWAVSNAPATIDNPGALQSPVLAAASVQLVASDPDGGALQWAASGLPDGLSLDDNGLITGTPTVEDAYSVTVTVTDDEGESTEASFAWQIAEPAIDVTNPGPQETPFGDAVNLDLVGVDPNGGAVTFTVDGLPPGLTYNDAQTRIEGAPSELGDFQVVVAGQGPSGGAVISFTWDVLNLVPEISAIAPQLSVTRIPAAAVTLSATDPDGGTPQLMVDGLPPGISFDPDTLELSGTPNTGGDFIVTVTATDDEDSTATVSFDWTVEGFESPVRINEVVASNSDSLLDEDGDSPDWIELHNPTSLPISLADWSLEDAGAQWMFPAISLPAGEYLIVFASDKDRAVAGSELHTNFKISKEGDSLALVDGDGFVIDRIGDGESGLPRQLSDVSYGVAAGGQGYLAETTPGQPNSGLGEDFAPVLRPFSDRIYNVGEPVTGLVDTFDPDGDPLSIGMFPSPSGVTLGVTTGQFAGTADVAGTTVSLISIFDSDTNRTDQETTWHVIPAPEGPSSLVLNEYNAVSPSSELSGGFDPAFGEGVLGNGGDWFEFVVVQDQLDIRGWSIELWDRDNNDEMLTNSATLTFADADELKALPSGTIITISEDRVDDISLDVDTDDWHINLQSNDLDEGAFITADSQENFNSSRSNQNVIIRNADGENVSPVVGETRAWDDQVGGVGSGEVMSLCADPTEAHVDPINDYLDNLFSSSFGAPNRCMLPGPDPLIPDDDVLFEQSLQALRDSAVPYVEPQAERTEVMVVVSCLAGNGRVDTNVVNTGDADATYRVEFEGLSPREGTVGVNDWWRMPLTGRPDRDFQHVVTRDGVVIFDEVVTVACDSEPPELAAPEIQVINSCRDGLGFVAFQFVNPTPDSRSYFIEFEGTPNRSTTAPAHGQAVRGTSGRPNGTYDVLIRTTDGPLETMSVTVDC